MISQRRTKNQSSRTEVPEEEPWLIWDCEDRESSEHVSFMISF